MHNIVIGLVTRHVSGSNGVVAERDDLKSLQYYRFLPIAKKKKRTSLCTSNSTYSMQGFIPKIP